MSLGLGFKVGIKVRVSVSMNSNCSTLKNAVIVIVNSRIIDFF